MLPLDALEQQYSQFKLVVPTNHPALMNLERALKKRRFSAINGTKITSIDEDQSPSKSKRARLDDDVAAADPMEADAPHPGPPNTNPIHDSLAI